MSYTWGSGSVSSFPWQGGVDFASWARLAPRKLKATQGKATTSQKLCSPGIPSFLLPWTHSFGEAARAPEAPQDAWALPGAPLWAPSTSVLWAPEPSESWWHRSCGMYAGSTRSPSFYGKRDIQGSCKCPYDIRGEKNHKFQTTTSMFTPMHILFSV